MTRFALTLVGCLFPVIVHAQTCTPVGLNNGTGEYLIWGAPGAAIVWGAPVPAGKLWIVDMVGLATTDNRNMPYAIQRFHPNGHYVPMVGMTPSYGTPVLAWTGKLVMRAGEKVGGRVNNGSIQPGEPPFATMAVLFTGFELPETCLAVALGLQAAVVAEGGTIPVVMPPFTLSLTGTATPTP